MIMQGRVSINGGQIEKKPHHSDWSMYIRELWVACVEAAMSAVKNELSQFGTVPGKGNKSFGREKVMVSFMGEPQTRRNDF